MFHNKDTNLFVVFWFVQYVGSGYKTDRICNPAQDSIKYSYLFPKYLYIGRLYAGSPSGSNSPTTFSLPAADDESTLGVEAVQISAEEATEGQEESSFSSGESSHSTVSATSLMNWNYADFRSVSMKISVMAEYIKYNFPTGI